MKIKLYKRKRRFSPVAMADIAFLLLIFLILTTGVDENTEIKLPIFKYSQKTSYPKTIQLAIKKDGTLIVNNKPSSFKFLVSSLKLIPDKEHTIIRLMADRDINYSTIDRVLSLLQENEIYRIVLVTKEPNNERDE